MTSTLDHGHPQDEPCSLDSCGYPVCRADPECGCFVAPLTIEVGTADIPIDGEAACPCDWHKP